jgi:hypothetical protein
LMPCKATPRVNSVVLPTPQASRNVDLHSEERTSGTAHNVVHDPWVIATFDWWFQTRNVIVRYSNIVLIRDGFFWNIFETSLKKWKLPPRNT